MLAFAESLGLLSVEVMPACCCFREIFDGAGLASVLLRAQVQAHAGGGSRTPSWLQASSMVEPLDIGSAEPH